MDKITKLPWKATLNAFVNDSYVYIIQKDLSIADGNIATVQKMANAEYICIAVNSHDGLVMALKRSHACATVKDDGSCEGCFVSEALKAADGEGVKL